MVWMMSDFDLNQKFAANADFLKSRFLVLIQEYAKRHAKLVESYERLVAESECTHSWDRTRKYASTTYHYCSKCGASVAGDDTVDVQP